MNTLGTSESLLLLVTLGIWITPAFFYLSTLQATLKEVSAANRKLSPNMVWLSLIPIFGLFWNFILISKIASSIRAEFEYRGIPLEENKPAYSVGILYSLINCFLLIPASWFLTIIPAYVFWIIYWVKINNYKVKLEGNMLPK